MADSIFRRVPQFAAAVAVVAALAACAGSVWAAEPPPPPSPDGLWAGTDTLSSPTRDAGYEAGRRDASDQARRVQLSSDMICADATTQRFSVEDARTAVSEWGGPLDDPRYRPMTVVWRTPVARYPTQLALAGTPGAVGLLLFINAEGRVARVQAVCVTDPAFVAMAEQVVRKNRYSPSTLDGKPIRDLAYQIVAYGMAED